MPNTLPPNAASIDERRALMALMARAPKASLQTGIDAIGLVAGPLPDFTDLRQPESGLVMLRGRTGGTGAPFNLGEASVTRAAVRLATGETGFAYHLGRDAAKARLAALADALWQNPSYRAQVDRHIRQPVSEQLQALAIKKAARTASTKVDFFSLVRGEDQP